MGRTKAVPPIPLIEKALAYRVQPFSDHMDDTGASSAVFPISRCSLDILLMIFQELVDKEASLYDTIWSKEGIELRVAPLLALVCKHWRDVVYNAPRLWAVVVIDVTAYIYNLSLSSQPEQTRHCVERAKGAPVDLYLFRYTLPLCDDVHVTTSILSIVPNIRKLYVQFIISGMIEPRVPLLVTRSWPALRNTRELSYVSPQYHSTIHGDLAAHLKGMPRLNILRFDQSRFTIPHWTTGPPILPKLKSLFFQKSPRGHDWDEAARLSSFLSHASMLEELDVTVNPWSKTETLHPLSPPPTLALSNLHTVKSRGTVVLQPLLSEATTTPAITVLTLLNWENTHEPSHKLALSSWFIRVSNTLTTLILSVTNYSAQHHSFAPLVHLRTLSLICYGAGDFFKQLYDPGAANEEGSYGTEQLYLPSLRFLILSICRPLIAEHFEKFVKARCIPVNAQRKTAAGFPALENFVVITLDAPEDLNYVARTVEWDVAAVRESDGVVFELRWEFWEAKEAEPLPKKRKTKKKGPKQGPRRSARKTNAGARREGGEVPKRV